MIRGYQPGRVVIFDKSDVKELTQNIIITPHQLITSWDSEQFNVLLTLNPLPEIILLGTGAVWQMISPQNLMLFYEKNIGVEIMTTDAACRTFNVLASEGRHVAAGLVI